MKQAQMFKQNNNNFIKINENIRAKQVRVILPDGEQLGVLFLTEAIAKAKSFGLDLVEIASQANPPVCKILDFGKYRYELSKKQKQGKKGNSLPTKTVQFTPNTGDNDLVRKVNDIKKFLEKGHQVTVIVAMKGRENSHPEIAIQQMNKIQQTLGMSPSDKPSKQDSKIIAIYKPVIKEAD